MPVGAIAPAGCYGGPLEAPEPGTTCPDGTAPRNLAVDDALAGWLHLAEDVEHPLVAYDIGCDEGDATAFMRKMWCGAQALPFAVGKWFVGIGTGIMEWALEFRIAEILTPVAGLLSRVYETGLIGPIDLVHLAWTMTMIVAGLSMLRGRMGNGIREILTTFLLSALGIMMLANPSGYLEGARDLAQNTSGAVLEAVDGALTTDSGTDSSEVRNRLSAVMQRAFVAEPYELINWGEPLSGECATARDQILAQGPWGSDDRPRQIMRDHGCDRQADYNANPTDNRAVASFTVAAASVIITLLLISLALAVFVAQITLVLLFSTASLVWVVALFPGARTVLWWWLGRLAWAVLVTVTSVFLLSWVAITTTVVLDNTSDVNIIQRSLIVIILAFVAYKARGSIDKALDGTGSRIALMMRRATSPPLPHAAPSAAPGKAGAMSASPVALGSTATQTTLHGAQRAQKGVKRVPVAAQRAVYASEATDRGLRSVGLKARDAGRAVVMAPVVLPNRIAERQTVRQQRASARSSGIRERMEQSRATRQQWRQGVTHPVRTTRQARAQAQRERAKDTFDWM